MVGFVSFAGLDRGIWDFGVVRNVDGSGNGVDGMTALCSFHK